MFGHHTLDLTTDELREIRSLREKRAYMKAYGTVVTDSPTIVVNNMTDRLPDITPDEERHLLERRAQQALEQGPLLPVLLLSPSNQPVTPQEWHLLQLHRIAQQARIPGSGVVANAPDPMQQQHAVAIVVLRSMQAELKPQVDRAIEAIRTSEVNALAEALSLIDRWLGILGADGQEARSPDPGAG